MELPRIVPSAEAIARRALGAVNEFAAIFKGEVPASAVERRLREIRIQLIKFFPRSSVCTVFRKTAYGNWQIECEGGKVILGLTPTGSIQANYRGGDLCMFNPSISADMGRLVQFIQRCA